MNYIDQLLSMNYPITNQQAGANITNLLGTLYTNQMNWQQNQAAMAHADRAAAEADQRTRQLYNDLYSPAARVKQLKEAGLSVGLMYGQGGMGGSAAAGAQAQTPSQIPMQAPHVEPDYDALNLISMALDNALKMAQKRNIDADTENKNANLPLIKQTIENLKKTNEEIDTNIQLNISTIEKQTAEKALILQQEGKEKEAQQLLKAQKEYQETLNEIEKIKLDNEPDRIEKELKKLDKEISHLEKQAKKIGLETEVIRETKTYIVQKTMNEALQSKWVLDKLNEEQLKYLKEQTRALKRQTDVDEAIDKLINDLNKDAKPGETKAIVAFLRIIKEILMDN